MRLPPSVREWVAARRQRLVLLVYGEPPPPPPPPGPRGAQVRRAPPPPPPKEPPLSIRRLLIVLEVVVLALGVRVLGGAWRQLLGGWPTRANFFPPRVLRLDSVRTIGLGPGQVWVAGAKQLTVVRGGNRIRPFEEVAHRLDSGVVTSLWNAQEGMWIGTVKGLALHDGRRTRRVTGRGAPTGQHVTCVVVDASGRVWAGTAREGLFVREAGTWRQFKSELHSPYVTALVPDEFGGVLVGLYAGGIVRTDGRTWTPWREPARLKGKPVRRIVVAGPGRFAALVGDRLWLVSESGWRAAPGGLAITDLASRPGGGMVVVTTGGGDVLRLAADGHPEGVVAAGRHCSTVAVGPGAVYAGAGTTLWRITADGIEPLTDAGEFFVPGSRMPPAADCPRDWRDPRYRKIAGPLGWSCLLVALAMAVRARRWKFTGAMHAWRLGSLRIAAWCLALLGGFLLTEWSGWIATAANGILLMPLLAFAAAWVLVHWVRIAVHEWVLRRDAFFMGVSIAFSSVGLVLWWVGGALVPSILVCATGGLFFGRSLRGIRAGTWRGMSLAWGVAVMLFQQAALLPPLLFAGITWGRAALSLRPTSPLTVGMAEPPEVMAWSPDGQRAAYAVARGPGASLELVRGWTAGEWTATHVPLPQAACTPAWSPDAAAIAICSSQGRDALVECLSADGVRLWRSRIPGSPATGHQPCWAPDGTLLVLTRDGEGTAVWRLQRAKGDALRLLTVPRRLSWPSLSTDGTRLAAAAGLADGAPGLALVSLATQRMTLLEPAPRPGAPLLVFEPSEEGRAILRLLENARAAARAGLARLRDGMQGVFGAFGWAIRLPEFWVHRTWTPPPPPARFRWRDYDTVRDVLTSTDGGSLACIARRNGGGDEVFWMHADGSNLRILHRSTGLLHDLRWAAYKNRITVIEETVPMLAPFPVRALLMFEGLPDQPTRSSVAPFAHWLAAPAFSPDGQRLTYGAPDRFWTLDPHPRETWGMYEVALESEIGVLPPAAPRAEGGEKK